MQLADLEYHYIVDELSKRLSGSRVGKVYQVTTNLFKIMFASRESKHTLIFQLPDYITLTKRDIPSPQQPSNFTMALRKRIENAVVNSVEQPAAERIVILNLDVRGEKCRLVIELFSNGNIIFCNSQGIIDLVYRSESWRDRELKRGVPYKLPPSKIPPLEVEERFISLNNRKTLMAGILHAVSISPKYLEEALTRAGVDSRTREEPGEGEKRKIVEAIREVCTEANFNLYKKEGKAIDYAVCKLSKYSDYEREEFSSVLELIDSFYEPTLHEQKEVSPAKDEVARRIMIERLAELEKEALELKLAGDTIYNRYSEIEIALELVRKGKREGKSEQEINNMLLRINPNASLVGNILKIKVP